MGSLEIAPAGLLRLDAAVSPDGDGVLVRLRTATALGPPLAPYAVLDNGPVDRETGFDLAEFPQDKSVAAIVADHPVSGIDVTGYRLTCSEGPTYAVAGAPLIGYPDPGATGYLARGRGADDDPSHYLLTAPWLARWQLGTESVRSGIVVVDPRTLQRFLSRAEVVSPLRSAADDPLGDAAPWRDRVDDLLGQHDHPYLPAATLLDSTDPDGQGRVDLDLGLWWSMAGLDPTIAALSGSFGLLPLGGDPVLRVLTGLAVVAVPSPTGEPGEPAAWAAAHAYADGNPQLQNVLHAIFYRLFGQDVVDRRLAEVHPSLRVVFLHTAAISVPLPDLPRPPGVTPAPGEAGETTSGVVVEGHQGGLVAITRSDGTETRDDVRLLPPSGLVTDAWAATTAPPGPVTYAVWTQDLWGRWGPPGTTTCPRREPDVPPPLAHAETRPADPAALPAAAPASPGAVVVRAVVSAPRPGGRPVDAVTATLSNATGSTSLHRIADPTGGPGDWWETTVDAAPTTPGGSVAVSAVLTAHAGGRSSVSRTVSATVVDPRPPVVHLTSRALHLAAPAGPDGVGEIDLAVDLPVVPPGTTFRVYVADEAALVRGAAPLPVVRRDRVDRLVGLTDRTRYLRLPDDVIRVVDLGGGRRALRLRWSLPGRATPLRVVQVVAVSPAGIETPAATAGAFVVGARLVDVPPTPVLVARCPPGRVRWIQARVSLTAPGGGGPGLALRGAGASETLPAELWWAPDSPLAGPDRAVLAQRLELIPMTPDVGSERLVSWVNATSLDVPPGVPAYTPLRLWARVAWPDESRWTPGTAPAATSVSDWPPGPTPSDAGPIGVPSAWSAFSPGVGVMPSDDARAVTCAVGATVPGITMHWPALGVHGPPWTVRIGAPGFPLLVQAGREATLAIISPPGWPDRRMWRISVTAPDGSAGPVWDGMGTQLS